MPGILPGVVAAALGAVVAVVAPHRDVRGQASDAMYVVTLNDESVSVRITPESISLSCTRPFGRGPTVPRAGGTQVHEERTADRSQRIRCALTAERESSDTTRFQVIHSLTKVADNEELRIELTFRLSFTGEACRVDPIHFVGFWGRDPVTSTSCTPQ